MSKQLSQDELNELQALESEVLSQDDANELSSLESEILTEASQRPVQTEATGMEAFGAGVIEGVPFLKDAIAAKDAVVQAMNDDVEDSLDSLYQKYQLNKEEIDQQLNSIDSSNPYAKLSGDIVATTATMGLGGSLKGAQALTWAAGTGAVSGLSRSEERTLYDATAGAATSAVFHGLGILGKQALQSEAASAAKNVVTGLGKKYLKKINKHLVTTDQSVKDFSESLFRRGIIKAGDTIDDLAENVSVTKQKVGQELSGIYKAIDDSGKVKINAKDIHSRIKREIIDELITSDVPEEKQMAGVLSAYIDDAFKSVRSEKVSIKDGVQEITKDIGFEDWSLQRLHKFQIGLASQIKNVLGKGPIIDNTKASLAKEQKKMLGVIINTLEDSVDDASSLLDDININKNVFKQTKLDFRNLTAAEEIVQDRLIDAGKQIDVGAFSKLKDLISNGVSLKSMGAAYAVSGGNPAAPIVAMALRSAQQSPAFAAMGASTLRNMGRLSEFITRNPNHPLVTNIATAAALSEDALRNEIVSSIGKMELSISPVKRNTEDALSKVNAITGILEASNPKLAASLRNLAKNADQGRAGAILDQISKDPAASEYFEPGIGFDGIVHDPQDKQILENQLKTTKMPAAQRQRLLNDLRSNGIIPDMQSVPPRRKTVSIPEGPSVKPKY